VKAMQKSLKITIVGILSMFILKTVVYGESLCHRFVNNGHDTLLIGEITAIDDEEMVIYAVDYIVSATCLNFGDYRRQLRPEVARVISSELMVEYFSVGDYVLASLNLVDEMFRDANGIYRVWSLDSYQWGVDAGENSDSFTEFVNNSISRNAGEILERTPTESVTITILTIMRLISILIIVMFVAEIMYRKSDRKLGAFPAIWSILLGLLIPMLLLPSVHYIHYAFFTDFLNGSVIGTITLVLACSYVVSYVVAGFNEEKKLLSFLPLIHISAILLSLYLWYFFDLDWLEFVILVYEVFL